MKIRTPDDDEREPGRHEEHEPGPDDERSGEPDQEPDDEFLDEPGPSFRFTQRWQRRRAERSSKAMWTTMGLDLALLALIVLMVWVAFRTWD